MHQPNPDIGRTAFKYIDASHNALGAGLPHGINQVCPCCKAGGKVYGHVVGQVDRITDPVDLNRFTNFYDRALPGSEFAAYHCHSCGYEWSWFKLPDRAANTPGEAQT